MAQDDIQGQVVDAQGNPVSGAIVELTKSYQSSPTGQEAVQRTTTDSNGNYIFEGHPDGDGTTQEWHVSCYNHNGSAYVNSFNNPGVTADLPSNVIPDASNEWPLDEGSGTVGNDVVGGVDVSFNFENWVSGSKYVGGFAKDFDGSGDEGTTATIPALEPDQDFTLEIWFDASSVSLDDVLFYYDGVNNDRISLTFDGSGGISLSMADGYTQSNAVLGDYSGYNGIIQLLVLHEVGVGSELYLNTDQFTSSTSIGNFGGPGDANGSIWANNPGSNNSNVIIDTPTIYPSILGSEFRQATFDSHPST